MIRTGSPQLFRPVKQINVFLLLASLLILGLVLTSYGSRSWAPPHVSEKQSLPQEMDITLANHPPATTLEPEWREPVEAASLAIRGLPLELEGKPELMAFRTANSATFEMADGNYKTILSTNSLHYQTAVNNWEIIEPAFRLDPETDSFIVAHNSIRSRAGLSEAWLSTTAKDVTLRWQASELGYVAESGMFEQLAQALPENGSAATQYEDGHLLHYRDGWTDPTLSEQLISAPGSVEHLLVLEEPPQVSNASLLELRANLTLLPNATIWANGQQQNGRFQTQNAIEIRNTAGNVAFILDPVRAFELDNPGIDTAGEYGVWPAGKDGEWIIALRTPISWWLAPDRTYPAVIDPTMRVLQTSGNGAGMAWLGSGGDAPNQNYQTGGVVLGRMVSEPYVGFMQFNVMPALLTNHPLQVAAAELLVTPSYYWIPSYKHDSDDGPDWEKQTIKHNATLWQINLQNLCPDPTANSNCWSMIDNRLAANTAAFNWVTRPDINDPTQTTELGTEQLAVGPANKGGKGQTTFYDVTNTVRDWYNVFPQPNHGPAFMIRHNSSQCLLNTPAVSHTPPPYQIEGWPSQVPLCTRFALGPQSAQLHITYNALLLNFGQSMLNRPGVPSFYEGTLADSNHQYKLATNPGQAAWRVVAVRGNHALPQTIPARADLKLLNYTGTEPDILLENTSSTANDQTSYVLINDHACASSGICNPTMDLRAEVIATNANSYPQDQDRNYRVEYELADNHSLIYGTNPPIYVNDYGSDELMRLLEFDLAQYDSLGIIVTGVEAVEPGLIAPTNDVDAIDTIVTNKWAETGFGYIGGIDGSTQRSLDVTDIEKDGIWALTLANQEPPIPDIEIPSQATKYGFSADIMRCPWGTIPTIKWECQPVIIPTNITPTKAELGFTIYSEGGFQDQVDGSWCTINEGQSTPMIGPAVDNRWIVVGQGSVCWDAINGFLTTTDDSGVGLAVPHPLGASRGRVSPGFMYGSTMTTLPLPAGVKSGVTGASAITNGQFWPTPDTRINIKPFDKHWGDVLTTSTDYIDPAIMKIVGHAALDVELGVEASVAPTAVHWDIPWTIYPGSASSYVFEPVPEQSPPLHSAEDAVDLASLDLRLEGASGEGLLENLDYYKLIRPYAWQFREAQAKITQDATMGGATKLVQGAVLPPGAPRLPATEAGAKSCFWSSQSSSCLDVRVPNYSWSNGNGDKNVPMWELPDIHLEDNVGTLMLSDPNGLQVFSKDHPLNKLSAEAIAQSFSFDTWNATVTIDQDKCYPDDENEVTVIRGEGLIGLPSVGETGVPPSVKVAFKLCETELAEALLELEVPTPGVPVGSSGMGLNLISGKVTVGPTSTQIEMTVGFQTLDGATLSDGFGTVLIDTAGLFQLSGGATLVGTLNANLLLQVAWQPLDVLVNASITCCGGLIGGELYMHAWIGQGFQNKYPWLDDNSDFHFTGYVQAWLHIPEDYLIEWVPPFEITISLKIAFGEFCTNDTCTSYSWGMSAVLTVAGFDVGLYVDDDGPEFIFGSDDHVLIDQFGGGNGARPTGPAYQKPDVPLAPSDNIVTPGDLQLNLLPTAKSSADGWQAMAPADHGCTGSAMGPTLECVFTVDPGAGQAVFNTTWQNGDMQVSLTAPDNTIIDENNAVNYGITISQTNQTVTQVSYAVRPLPNQETVLPGNWKLTLANIGVGLPGQLTNNYRIMWFTDLPAPSFEWISPMLAGTPPVNNQMSLEWTALRAGQPLSNSVEMELIYTPLSSMPVDLEEFNGTLIANRVKANAGNYNWDVSHLASGEYAIGARINDRFAGNGTIVSWAPGTVLINDSTPPPAPNILATSPIHDALILEFARPNAPDLAGYLIEYTFPQPDGSARMMVRRLNPRGKWYEYFDGKQIWFDGTERVRLGGLLDGFTTELCLRAYDNSGNIGLCNNIEVELPRSPIPSLGAPQELNINIQNTGVFDISWTPPAMGSPATGYLVAYAPIGCDMPELQKVADQGAAPIDVGNVVSTLMSGLTPGQFYAVGVAAYDSIGHIGPTAGAVARYGNMADEDNDGLPDAWADAWGVSDANDDPDEDGATNGQEFQHGSNPLHADSDLDGYYDGEELVANSDLCSQANKPPFQSAPKLTLFGPANPVFQVAVNQANITEKVINIFNLGGGELNWSASSDEPWITLKSMDNTLKISVDPSMLSPGSYSGTVQINNLSSNSLFLKGLSPLQIQESYALPVSVTVLRPIEHNLLLPLIIR